jgi:dsDNA-binding SOS-regulon protein
MAVITQYVVQHKGVDKLVTKDKKEADQYDKMLGIADNLCTYIKNKGVELDEDLAEELSILLAKNKDAVSKLFRGIDAESLLEEEKAEVLEMKKA